MTTPKLSPSISIIIPVYNGGEAFDKCLYSIQQSNISPLEIIAVADGSGDLACEFGAKVLHNSASTRPAAARNKGATIAKGDIIFFIDEGLPA